MSTLFDPADFYRSEQEAHIFARFEIYFDEEEDEGWLVSWTTNDPNEDGHAETTTKFNRWFVGLEDALEWTGVTRRGWFGEPVNVLLLDAEGHWRPVLDSNRAELLDANRDRG